MSKRIWKTGYKYPIRESLCVIPDRNGESQFEAFQSILAYILHAQVVPETKNTCLMTPYEWICHNAGVMLYARKDRHPSAPGPYIIYEPKTITHYRAVDRHKVFKDPYTFYQAKGTQGFCQMFAYFLATDGTDGFKIVDQSKPIQPEQFHDLAWNTLVCLQKILTLFSNKEFFERFKDAFSRVDKKYYGIKQGTTFNQFVSDLHTLDLLDATYYIYDNPLNGIKSQARRESLWLTIKHPS